LWVVLENGSNTNLASRLWVVLENGSNTNLASRLQTCRQTTHKRLRELFDGIITTRISSI
jgi:hypothetical protein